MAPAWRESCTRWATTYWLIDLDEKNVQDMLGHVTYAVKADATNEAVLRELGVSNFDVAGGSHRIRHTG